MSDIYLAVSETPTVVTLTSAVINSAVASSVTVMNTVTVALDANSLSALENVTVTVGAAITGTVTVSSLPAISGTVTVGALPSLASNTDFVLVGEYIAEGINNYGVIGVQVSNFPATQPISGTVTANVVGFNPTPLETFGTGLIQTIADAEKDTIRSSLWIPVSSATNGTAGEGQILSQGYPMPAVLGAGTAQIGSVTASLAISSTAISSGVFSSLTSATLVPGNTARKMATVYNLGPGQLFVNAGATATTLGGGFMVALSSSDYLECAFTTTTLSALFASAGTASWVSH
jgi:hypothetical protein